MAAIGASPYHDLRPLQGESGGVYVSDLICSLLLPISLSLSQSQLHLSILSFSLSFSAVIVYLLDYRGTERSGKFVLICFLPAWCCIALIPGINTSRFRLYLTFWTVILFRPMFNKLISKFKKSFTFGEACLVTQGTLLVLYTSALRLYGMESYRTLFLAKQVANWLDWFIIHCSNPTSIILLASWAVLSVLSVLVVIAYKLLQWPVNTKTRKIFHLCVLLVYIPGLLYDPVLLSVASIGATVLFICMELIRWSEKLPRLTGPLSSYLSHFVDEKEGGSLILTNIYLLVGVSLPLWLWPNKFQTPAPLPLYAGLISVGVGDAASSIIGTLFGRTRWPGSHKTLEGALGGFIAQLGMGWIIGKLSGLPINFSAFSTVCLATSMFELTVDQVDNLTLPLVMYSGLLLDSLFS